MYQLICIELLDLKSCDSFDVPSHFPGYKTLILGKIGEGNDNPFQYSCLEKSMDGGAWLATVHGVTKSWTQLSNFTFTFFPVVKSLLANTIDMGPIPGLGRFHMQHRNY